MAEDRWLLRVPCDAPLWGLRACTVELCENEKLENEKYENEKYENEKRENEKREHLRGSWVSRCASNPLGNPTSCTTPISES